ncbi:phosphatidylinositol 4-phosphate 5-kinase [Acrasis kona]|uniref:Phosphatidylinositol 4-phosphate 5-kinase n=1 Tax=Acrasis kona TaxID=1008807 RepID=A0AAW2Z2W2_9EUKA
MIRNLLRAKSPSTPTSPTSPTSRGLDPSQYKEVGSPGKVTFEIEGVGTCQYTGTLDQNGQKFGRGELVYPNGTIYVGEFVCDVRHGLGTLIFSKTCQAIGQWIDDLPSEQDWKIKDGQSDYFGGIVLRRNANKDALTKHDLLKNEHGEFNDAQNDESYFGTFKDDERSGFGVAIFENGDQYSGGWLRDQINDSGTYVYKDGTVFQGMYKANQRRGKGTLYLPNGDTIEGTWRGDTVKEGSTDKCNVPTLNLISSQIDLSLKHKKNEGFMVFKNDMLMKKNPLECNTNQKWHTYYVLHGMDYKKEVEWIISKQGLSYYFQFSYNTNAYTARKLNKKISIMVSRAIDDIKSFVMYVSDKIHKSINPNDIAGRTEIIKFVSNYVHANIHQTLFNLYQTYYREKDLFLNQKINYMVNSCSPASMGVDTILLPASEPPYLKSIKLLETIAYKQNVIDKINVLSDVRESIIVEACNNRLENKKSKMSPGQLESEKQDPWQPGADDLTSIYTFVFVKARINDHHSLYHYISDWRDASVTLLPVSHIINFYEGFLTYIKELDVHLINENGEFISCYMIGRIMMQNIENSIYKSKNYNISFSWLPSLLCHISMETSNKHFVSGQSIILSSQDKEVKDIYNANLLQSILDKLSFVQFVLNNPNIGFYVQVENETDIAVVFTKVYPSHIYLELGHIITKFIKFDLLS